MRRNNESNDWKTTACLLFSVLLHAALIYYIAITQFGDTFSSGKTKDASWAPKASTTVEIEALKVAPKPSPDEKKIVKVLPKKVVASLPLPAPKVKAKPKVVAKAEPKPEIKEAKEEKVEETKDETTEAAAVVPPAPEKPEEKIQTEEIPPVSENKIDIQKEKSEEQKVREQMVEKILNDEKPAPEQPEATTEAKPQPTPTPAPAAAPAPVAAAAAATGTGKDDSGSGSSKKSDGPKLQVKNDYELRPMPGNRDPEYPNTDRFAHHQGEIKFMAEVAPDGRISDIRMLKSSGYKTLDLAAYQAFKEYKYMPGQQSYVVKSFIFTLKGPAQTLPSRLAVRQQEQK